MQHGALAAPPKNRLRLAPDLELSLAPGKEPLLHSQRGSLSCRCSPSRAPEGRCGWVKRPYSADTMWTHNGTASLRGTQAGAASL